MSSRRDRKIGNSIKIDHSTGYSVTRIINDFCYGTEKSSHLESLSQLVSRGCNFSEAELTHSKKRLFKTFLYHYTNKNFSRAFLIASIVYSIGEPIEAITSMLLLLKIHQMDTTVKNYIYHGISRYIFVNEDKIDSTTQKKLRKKLFLIHNERASEYKELLPIEFKNTNKKNILILVDQFTSRNHSPTKISLDYTTHLKKLGYNPFIINTASIPTYIIKDTLFIHKFHIIKEYSNIEQIEGIPFYQPSITMPNIDEYKNIINKINTFSPSLIFSIGGSNILADVLSKHIKTILIPTTSDLSPASRSTYRLISREFNQHDEDLFSANVIDKEKIVYITHQLQIPEAKKTITKKDLAFTDDDFVICIVSNRLVDEISDNFINTIKSIHKKNNQCRFLFIGDYPNYSSIAKEHNIFHISKSVGRVENLADYYCACDVFLNPDRAGGGFSSIYAMKQGLPVITRYIGDIGTTYAGRDLSFDTWDEAIEEVNKLASDKNYYAKKSAIFKQIADSRSDFNQMVKEVMEVAEKLPNP